MVHSSGVYTQLQTTYFNDSLNPMCCAVRSTVYSRSFKDGLLKRVRLLDRDIGTPEV